MASRPPAKAKQMSAPAAAAEKPAKPLPATARKVGTARKAAKAAETVTLRSIFEQLAQNHEMPKQQGYALMAAMVDLMTSHLVKGDKVRMNGIGVLEVKNRPARMGRNPATGQSLQIAASKKIAFRAAKELKTAI